MKISEEKSLKKAMVDLKRYAKKYPMLIDFYRHIDTLSLKSLQDLSLKNDLGFFEECRFILNVIISIIAHPHLSNQREEIILRTEQIHSFSNEMFMKTIKDSTLWKKQNNKIIPLYGYYYQNIDELKIYENIFIIRLIDLIEQEVYQYHDFYSFAIKTIHHSNSLLSDEDEIMKIFVQIDFLKNKIQKIKSTYFYKEVSKSKLLFTKLHPTNILLKDRLYRHCFKFYKKIRTYYDQNSLFYDFKCYFYCLLMKTLKKQEFKISSKHKNQTILLKNNGLINTFLSLQFYNHDFKIQLNNHPLTEGISIHIENRKKEWQPNQIANHLLILDTSSMFSSMKDYTFFKDNQTFSSIEAISLWNIATLDQQWKYEFKSRYKENELIEQYLQSKLMIMPGSYRIYANYCPVCKEKKLINEGEFFQCLHCHSSYVFDSNQQNIWYIKIRRV